MNLRSTADDPEEGRQGRAPATAPGASHLLAPLLQMMAAKATYAAAELGIADRLAEGVQTTDGLAAATGTHAPSLRRLLHVLVGLGLVARQAPDRFELTEAGRPLRDDVPDSVRGVVLMGGGPQTWRSWEQLVPSLRTGTPAWDLAHGMSWIEYYTGNPGPAAVFHRSQAEHTRDAIPGIVAAADFSRFPTVVDVGGGDGTLIARILRDHPGLDGVLFDAPGALAGAERTLSGAGVQRRCRVVDGDFFEKVPADGDAYILKEILHDWDDQRSVDILRTIRSAIRPGGRLLVIERRLPDTAVAGRVETHAYLRDLLMLVVTGGRERTESEFAGLFTEAGFSLEHATEPFAPFGYSVLEGAPV
ncbi:methyltransferase [Streptomyces sp. NPDC053499]|uniref:methyltransferase n=1 Tax=Streptomyces sp. NPDC053499 TaxID=3365707 RepID=UPI0037D2B814